MNRRAFIGALLVSTSAPALSGIEPAKKGPAKVRLTETQTDKLVTRIEWITPGARIEWMTPNEARRLEDLPLIEPVRE